MPSDLPTLARRIIDANQYLVLATSDRDGRPWISPVYFAHDGYQRFYWVSRPEREHSRNVAVRPDVAIAIFDSTQPIGTGEGVYITATAEQVEGRERLSGIECFSRRSIAHGGAAWTLASIDPPAGLRLYRATARDVQVLDPAENRVSVPPSSLGSAGDVT